jgi:hypothetical protein
MSRKRLTGRLASAVKNAEGKKKNNGGELVRNLDGFEYDSSKAAVLKKALHNINVSLGTMISAMKDLSMLRGSEVTPDGLLGGRGFVMPFKDMKQKLNIAINDLSDVTDTLADELTNPKWGLSAVERKRVRKETENIEEEIGEIEEVLPGTDPLDKADESEEIVEEEGTSENLDLQDINPEDVVDSSEVDAIKRYENLIKGNVKDRVASVLSKQIVANLLKGDK